MQRSLSASLCGGAAIVVLASAGAAAAQTRSFNIPAEAANQSIPTFARQAGVQLVAPGEQLAAIATPAVRGSMDVHAALAKLLSGTPLEVASDSPSAIVLRLASKPDPARPDPSVSQVVVTAPRRESTARAVEYAAPNVVNVQSAETIAKYPDFNAAEALGRIPGVSLSIDTGEGRFVTIRGIDSNLDGATFGGVVLLNSYPGGTYFSGSGRAVEFDTVPVGAVDRIEVTKTGLPDHEAEGIGGSVELSPRSPRAITKPFIDFDLGGGYENLRSSWAPINEQVVLGSRFGFGGGGDGFITNDKPFSFVLTQYQHNDRRSVDDFEEAYGIDNSDVTNNKVFDTAEFRRYNYHRRRFGYGGELDFDPNPDHHFFARADIAGYTENVNRQRLVFGNLEFDGSGNSLLPTGPVCAAGAAGPCTYTNPAQVGGFLSPDMQAAVTLRDEKETHRNSLFAVGGSDKLGGATLDYQAAYTKATYSKPYDRNWTFNNPNAYSLAYNNTNSNFPSFNVLSGPNYLDPSLYALSGLQNSQEKDEDHEWSGAANLTVPVQFFSDEDFFKVGVKGRFREKTVNQYNQSYSIDTTNTLADFQGGGPYTYYENHYAIGYQPNGDALYRYLISNPQAFIGGEQVSRDLGADYRDNENVLAGYAEGNFRIDKLGVLAGVRVENTDATYRGYVQGVDASGNPLTPYLAANKQNYTNAFPTVQLRYDFAPQLVGRVTYSTGIARPGFTQITATTNVDVGGGAASTGNPNLKPTYANNFDASLEYYLPQSGIVSLGGFDKELSNYIVTRTALVSSYLGINQLWRLSTYENASAYARGLEAQYVQKFTWLPGPLGNIGLDTNVTYVSSQVELFSGVKATLPGTSPVTANAAIFYEDGRLQLRAAAEYVAHNLFTVGGSTDTNIYEDTRVQVDFTSSYAVNPNLTVYFNVKNLNNNPLRFYEGSPNRPVQREFYLQTFEFGVRTHF